MGKKLMPKMKMRMKKSERMNLIFEFSVSKVGYMAIFMKIWENKILPIFYKTFLTNQGKNQDGDEKILENEIDSWIQKG